MGEKAHVPEESSAVRGARVPPFASKRWSTHESSGPGVVRLFPPAEILIGLINCSY
jgi:hypothetical protein